MYPTITDPASALTFAVMHQDELIADARDRRRVARGDGGPPGGPPQAAPARHLTGAGAGQRVRFCTRSWPRATRRPSASWVSTTHTCWDRPWWIGVPTETISPSRTAR